MAAKAANRDQQRVRLVLARDRAARRQGQICEVHGGGDHALDTLFLTSPHLRSKAGSCNTSAASCARTLARPPPKCTTTTTPTPAYSPHRWPSEPPDTPASASRTPAGPADSTRTNFAGSRSPMHRANTCVTPTDDYERIRTANHPASVVRYQLRHSPRPQHGAADRATSLHVGGRNNRRRARPGATRRRVAAP